ncbi:adenine nucleotide alpha hydrolases-domain containing protein kinase [Striga asiatica]|uniref:Adenine nucleotide alpha hydrolases-domain containing protein kinase n=1 Tax=Striga asiatica TaxID=4170 RepID=A0A5A7P1B7_STRAF|nr:adenine nucleotide alpha hydrolases-domain containing protein kinase [Striga asiatica]
MTTSGRGIRGRRRGRRGHRRDWGTAGVSYVVAVYRWRATDARLRAGEGKRIRTEMTTLSESCRRHNNGLVTVCRGKLRWRRYGGRATDVQRTGGGCTAEACLIFSVKSWRVTLTVERFSFGVKEVIVGTRLDDRAKELLDWELVKVVDSGDSVVAIHVCRNSGKYSVADSISNEKIMLDGYLKDYEGCS